MKNRSIGPVGLCRVVILSQIVLIGCGKRDDAISIAESDPPNVLQNETLDIEEPGRALRNIRRTPDRNLYEAKKP